MIDNLEENPREEDDQVLMQLDVDVESEGKPQDMAPQVMMVSLFPYYI